MKRFGRIAQIALVLISAGFLPGCPSGGALKIIVTITNKISNIAAGAAAVTLNVTVQNDSTNSGVTWTLTAAGAACAPTCGSLSGATTTSVSYTPPANTPAAPNNMPTITATSVKDTTKSDSDAFTIPLVIVTITNKITSIAAGAAAVTLNATVQNDPTNSGVSWTLTAAGAACAPTCGSLSGATTTSVSYTPPATTPAAPNNTPTIKATSVKDPTKSDSDPFTIPPVIVTITNKITSIAAGAASVTLNATVQNDPTNGGVAWTLTASGVACAPTCGSLSGATGLSVVYTPPANTPAAPNNMPTIKATSVKDPTQSDSDPFTIPPVIVTITNKITSIAAGAASVTLNATVQNDPANSGVTWTLTAAGLSCAPTCGSLSGPTTTSVSYTPPTSVPTAPNNTPTITATSVKDPTKSDTDNFTITAAPPISVTVAPNTASVPVNGTQTFTATLTNDTGNKGVTWTLAGAAPCPGTGCGSVSPTSTTSGVATTYTAPGAVPSPSTVTITATSVADPTKSASATITVTTLNFACGTGSESLLNGQYAIALRGFDASGPVGIGATFDADGAGHVAKLVGIEDINTTSGIGPQLNLSIITGSSSYSVGSDHRGCLTIATSAGTQTFRFSVGTISSGVASNGHIIQFDTGSHTAGVLRKQNPTAFSTAQINGNYAFGASGPRVGGGKFAVVGMLSLNGVGGVNNTSVVDFNDKGNVDNGGTIYPASPISISGGTYNIFSSGRGTFTLNIVGVPNPVNGLLYVVSSGESLILSSDPQSAMGGNLFVGSALLQSGAFSASSLNATSVLYASGLATSGATTVSRVTAGLITIPSSGTLSFSGWQNSGGTINPQSAPPGTTYSVASNGRVTFAGGGGGGAPIVYLVSANRGFVLFTDGSLIGPHVESGFVELQTGSPFSTSSANGTYAFGTIQPEDLSVSDEAGFATFNGVGNISGTSDSNQAGTLKPGNPFTSTYSIDATGLGVVPANCTIGTTCETIFFIISTTKAAVFDVKPSATPTHPNLQIGEQ